MILLELVHSSSISSSFSLSPDGRRVGETISVSLSLSTKGEELKKQLIRHPVKCI